MRAIFLSAAILMIFGITTQSSGVTPNDESSRSSGRSAKFTKQEAKQYLNFLRKLDPTKGDLYQKLLRMFPGQTEFTAYQITAVTDPQTKKPINYKEKKKQVKQYQSGPIVRDAFTPEQAREQLHLAEKQKLGEEPLWNALTDKYGSQDWYTRDQVNEIAKPSPTKKDKLEQKGSPPAGALTVQQARQELDSVSARRAESEQLWKDLVDKYGEPAWYTADQLRDVRDNAEKDKKFTTDRKEDDPVEEQIIQAQERPVSDFKSPRIRQNWRDVLYEEDPSQDANATKVLKDLVGATFSYANDERADTTTWTAIGALIWPWEHYFKSKSPWVPAVLALAPSISINRVETNGNPKMMADSLIYRLGAYSQWYAPGSDSVKLQVRAAGVYATDTGMEAGLPGYEVDLEPGWQSNYIPLGYQHVWITKAALLEPPTDNVVLSTQLRTWLHIEGGDVQDNGKSWDSTKGSFFRIGPTVQFQVNAPNLLFGKDASLTTLYSYLPAITGSHVHQSYFKISGVYDLVKDDVLNHKVALTAQYERGGLNFTKEDVDTFTIGLGVLY
jgi:hypothetical protein